MKRQYKKPRSLLLKIFLFIIKIPFYILIAGLTAKEKNTNEDIADIYLNNPRLSDPRPLRDRPRHERY